MKHKIFYLLILLFVFAIRINAEEPKPGYTDWSTESSGDENEESAIQYGRQVPETWSPWSEEQSDSLDQRTKVDETRWYAFNAASSRRFFSGAGAKELYSWDFGEKKKVIYFYADIDTYVRESETNYEGPPLQLYCDGDLIASVGKHDVYRNWNPDINSYCRYMVLRMSDNSSNGRNRTSIVGTWVSTGVTLYSHVETWTDGRDWRFKTPYTRVYGSNPHIPTSRMVYSHPITYSITYYLDGGTPTKDLVKNYTVLDEFDLVPCIKLGYDFLYYCDQNGNKIEKINKGTYGNITLYAKYKRRLPVIYVGYTYFEVQDENMNSSEVIDQSNARAIDELEGDLSDKIIIKSIEYENKNKTVSYPDYLELDSEDTVNITFVVSNNVGGTAEVTRKFYILGKGKDNKDYKEGLQIYSRYIDEKYLYTLSDNSIWNTNGYKDKLYEAFSFMEG